MNLSITFRAGGTSLSGQTISDSILVITSRNFSNFKIASDASYISLEPALTGAKQMDYLHVIQKNWSRSSKYKCSYDWWNCSK